MAAKRGGDGESKVGLVIVLVFSLLGNIGLGIGLYMYASADDTKDKKITELEKVQLKNAKDEREWYKFQANLYRTYMGYPPAGDDLTKLQLDKDTFDKGGLGAGQPDLKQATDAIKGTEKTLGGWNVAQKRPTKTYKEVLAAATATIGTLGDNAKKAADAKAEAEKDKADAQEQLKKAQETWGGELAKLREKADKNQTNDRQAIKDLSDKLTAAGAALEKARTDADNALKTAKAEVAKKDVTIGQQKALITQKTDELAATKQKGTDAPRSWRTDWKVVAIDRRGTNPYINLGWADRVQPQLTFSIHALGLDGRPVPQAKGTLEVVKVVDAHLSQTRVTSVRDPARDPIMKGDILYNPSWDPALKKHVALAGIIDLTGDGRDSSAEFRRALERQNIVVDAYMDMKDKDYSIKGKGITVQTDYLVLGDSLDTAEAARAKGKEDQAKIDKRVAEMQAKAKDNGVTVVPLRKYLEMIGYRVPPPVSERPPASTYQPGR